MSRKRGNGEGSVYKRKRDGRWVACITLGWKANGTLDRKEFVRSTRGEAVEAMDKAKREHAEGKPVKFETQTVGHFLSRWLEDSVKLSVKPKTFESYSWTVNNHLIPGLGRYQLQKLGPQEFQTFINDKVSSDLSTKSIQILRDTLRVALNDAMKWSLVLRNVAPLVKIPRREKKEKPVWSIAQAKAFLSAVEGDRLEAVFRLAVCFGVRQGEILALRWADVDFDGGFVYIRATQQRVGGKIVSGSPKTESSRRRIPLASTLTAALCARKRVQEEERIWAAGDWKETGLVFTTRRGTPFDVSNLTRIYRAAAKRAGLAHLPFHNMRHTASSLMHEAGFPDQDIHKTLGHGSYRTTQEYYIHSTPDAEARIARELDKLFSPVAVTVAVNGEEGKPN